MELGNTIAKLRKEQRLTQEQLGLVIGVSGQAVSKWENGGMPDAELLPVLADCLGVTIDTLYGREDRPKEDMRETLIRYLTSLPKQQRMMALFRLLCWTQQRPYYTDNQLLSELSSSVFSLPVKSCYSTDPLDRTETPIWLRSMLSQNFGLQLCIPSEDFPLFLLMPEPEDGYEANFADDDSYRTLFSTLAKPGTLEILRCFYRRKQTYYSSGAVAKLIGVSAAYAVECLETMLSCHLLVKKTVETDEGSMDVYMLHDTMAYVPFMALARWFMEEHDAFFSCWLDRTDPILKEKQL